MCHQICFRVSTSKQVQMATSYDKHSPTFPRFPYYDNLFFIGTIHAHSLLNLESMASPSTSPFTKRGVLIELNFIGMFYNNNAEHDQQQLEK